MRGARPTVEKPPARRSENRREKTVSRLLMCAVMRANAAALLALAGCAYQPGSFHSVMQDFSGQQTTVDCLDLAVDRRPDLPDGSAVVRFAFGNRCDHPVVVDLASASIIGRTADGQHLQLTAYDPRHEIQSMRIDGRAVGREALAFPADTTIDEICIDAASIAHGSSAQWMCLVSRPQTVEVP